MNDPAAVTQVIRIIRTMLITFAAAVRKGEPAAYLESELSEIGIGTVREYARSKNWGRAEMFTMLQEECARARAAGCTAGPHGLAVYFRCKRTGSRWCLTRNVRAAIFAQLVARGMLPTPPAQIEGLTSI